MTLRLTRRVFAAQLSATPMLISMASGSRGGESTFTLMLDLSGSRDAREPRHFRTQKGVRVIMKVIADRPAVVHLHGFGIELTAGPEGSETKEFVATATGRFPIHVHDATGSMSGHTQHRAPFAFLEVHPK